MTVQKKVMAKPTNKFSSLYLAVFIFTLNCGDALNITGITETNEVANLIGNIDENDWCPQQNGTGVVEDGMRPACPNPTNGSIQLPYQIVKQTRVKLQIINKHKKVVRLLVDERQAAGHQIVTWDLRDDNGDKVKNGCYRAQFFLDGEFKCHGDVQVIK